MIPRRIRCSYIIKPEAPVLHCKHISVRGGPTWPLQVFLEINWQLLSKNTIILNDLRKVILRDLANTPWPCYFWMRSTSGVECRLYWWLWYRLREDCFSQSMKRWIFIAYWLLLARTYFLTFLNFLRINHAQASSRWKVLSSFDIPRPYVRLSDRWADAWGGGSEGVGVDRNPEIAAENLSLSQSFAQGCGRQKQKPIN